MTSRGGSILASAEARVVICPSHEQMERWQVWADRLRKPKLAQFVPFVMDMGVRYLRQWGGQRTGIDELGLKLGQRDRKIVEQARDALDKLAVALRDYPGGS